VSRLIDENPGRVQAFKEGDEAVVNAFIGDLRDAHPGEDVSTLIEQVRQGLDEA
jgi:Asp-tRNA(Asn)/Glu-tRNA(Gln) amidotransferase B subunit